MMDVEGPFPDWTTEASKSDRPELPLTEDSVRALIARVKAECEMHPVERIVTPEEWRAISPDEMPDGFEVDFSQEF